MLWSRRVGLLRSHAAGHVVVAGVPGNRVALISDHRRPADGDVDPRDRVLSDGRPLQANRRRSGDSDVETIGVVAQIRLGDGNDRAIRLRRNPSSDGIGPGIARGRLKRR